MEVSGSQSRAQLRQSRQQREYEDQLEYLTKMNQPLRESERDLRRQRYPVPLYWLALLGVLAMAETLVSLWVWHAL